MKGILIMREDNDHKKNKIGIKHPSFTSSGKNGESHRLNKVKKARQGQANRLTRASLYQSRGSMAAVLWHAQLDALSNGTA